MTYDYNELLRNQLAVVKEEIGLDGYDFVVDSELSFMRDKDIKPNTIYVLTKALRNDRQPNIDTQPIQIFILSERNCLDVARTVFSTYAKKYNWQAFISGDMWIKQQYTDPVVLSNFNELDTGYRSVMYISATLYIMEDVFDVANFKINNIDFTPITFALTYSASMNTQQFYAKTIAQSVKSISTFSIVFSIPMKKCDFVNDIIGILSQSQGYTGNEDFNIKFTLNNVQFDVNMKLTQVSFTSSPNNAPEMSVGMLL